MLTVCSLTQSKQSHRHWLGDDREVLIAQGLVQVDVGEVAGECADAGQDDPGEGARGDGAVNGVRGQTYQMRGRRGDLLIIHFFF